MEKLEGKDKRFCSPWWRMIYLPLILLVLLGVLTKYTNFAGALEPHLKSIGALLISCTLFGWFLFTVVNARKGFVYAPQIKGFPDGKWVNKQDSPWSFYFGIIMSFMITLGGLASIIYDAIYRSSSW